MTDETDMDEPEDFHGYDTTAEWGTEREWVTDCGDPDCCMNFAPHFRWECYTPEMVEDIEREAEQSAVNQNGDV